MSLKPTPCTQGHIAQWLEHPVYNWEVLGSNPSLVIFLCGPTLSPLGHVSPLGHFPIGLLRSHEFNTLALISRRPLLPQFAIPPFALCLPWLLLRTLNFASLTSLMPISMAPLRKRSTCSSLRDLKWVDQIMSVG